MSESTELTIYARYYKDIEDLARAVEYECLDVLRPAPKGIYAINRVDPVMVDGREYFTFEEDKATGRKTRKVVNNITDLTTPIYTTVKGSEQLVVPAQFMKQKTKFLANEPILPFRGVKVIECLVRDEISRFQQFSIGPYSDEAVYTQFLNPSDEVSNDFICEIDPWLCKIKDICEPLLYELQQFIAHHEWHIFFIHLKETRLKIEKSIDYRAYRWILQQEELERQRMLKEHD